MESRGITARFSAAFVCLLFAVFGGGCGGGGGSVTTSSFTSNQYSTTGQGGGTQTTGGSSSTARFYGAVVSEGGAGRVAASSISPGHVSNATAVDGAEITLTPTDGSPVTVETDDSGAFSLEPGELPAGVYHVNIHHADLDCDFYVDLSTDNHEMLAEFASGGDCYSTMVQPDNAGWIRSIEPDGAYTISQNAQTLEEHTSDGVTAVYNNDGTEDWFLDDNANFQDDATDPEAPALDATLDTDSDGCHNMRDFLDDDNDNDSTGNFDDGDYNTNLLAANVRSVEPGCLTGVSVFAVDLEVSPDTGDAPLTVTAKAAVRGNPGAVSKYVWITGKPGAEPVETTTPSTTVTYDQYGAFILTVEVQLTNGEKIIDTYPVTVVKSNYTGGMVLQNEFSASCQGSDNCYTHDIDVDQYGNMFVLIDTWTSGDNRYQVDMMQPGETSISTTANLTIDKGYEFPYLINMALDSNGFIYTLDTRAPLAIYVHDALGNPMSTIDIDSALPAGADTLDVKGIAVDDDGNVYFGYSAFTSSQLSVYKCSKTGMAYDCGELLTTSSGDFVAILDIDLEIDHRGYLAVLASTSIKYYDATGELVASHSMDREYMNLAVGPDGTYYVAISELGGVISAYNSSGSFLYDITPVGLTDGLVWDMYVDKLGKLYVTTYSSGTVLVYAPEYMVPGAGRVAAAPAEVGGFNIRRVKAVPLQG